MFRTIILITRGIMFDSRSRRWAMFVLLMVALVMLFVGSTFLAADIAAPLPFLVYWGVCAFLTFAALLLALWDLLLLRAAGRQERRRMEKRMLDHDEEANDEE